MLNEKSDEDEHKSRVGVKRQSELLQQLLRPERDNSVTGGDGVGDSENGQQRDCRQDDSLLISLGFPPSPSSSRKRPNDDNGDQPNKRSSDGSQVVCQLVLLLLFKLHRINISSELCQIFLFFILHVEFGC